jgi:cobalt-zinc-cadmium efflux system protein
VVDTLTAMLTYSMQKGSVNIRALFLHNLSDALASVAVIVGGTLIIIYDMRWVDPAITIGIALYILYLSFTEIGGPIRTLMLGSPPGIDGNDVVRAIQCVDGVVDVHHVHLWQMQEHAAALDCHIVVERERMGETDKIRENVKSVLHERFSIEHSTLEFEASDNAHQEAQVFGHRS